MTVENISWSISTKECCRPRRGLNPRPPGLQSDGASNWATGAGHLGFPIGPLIELGFNDTSTLVGHFVSSPREREKRDRRDSKRDEREGQGRKRNRNESEETEEIKTSPPYPYCYKYSRPCPTISQYQLDAPVTKDTWHLRTTQPPSNRSNVSYFSSASCPDTFYQVSSQLVFQLRNRRLNR